MNKIFITYISILVAIFSGCSDSIDLNLRNGITPDGDVNISLTIPEMTLHPTRSETESDLEYKVNDISLLIYNGTGENISASQYEVFSPDNVTSKNKLTVEGNTISLTFNLKKDLRVNPSNLQFYFIANLPSSAILSNNTTVNDLKTNISDNTTVTNGDLVMCANATFANLFGSNASIVYLTRNAVKVTVSDAIPTIHTATDVPEEIISGTSFYPNAVFGNATSSSILAGITDSYAGGAFTTPSSYPGSIADLSEGSTGAQYFHSTANEQNGDKIGGKLFVITKAYYNGVAYYYRLDFVNLKKDDDGNITEENYFPALPNHWYQFVVEEVYGPGYASPADAAIHPGFGIKYKIHDHSPISFNMASDGFRELGVSHAIEYEGDVNIGSEYSDKTIYIKFYSKEPSEIPATSAAVKDCISIEDERWLELSDAVKVTTMTVTGDEGTETVDITGGEGSAGDPNDAGTIYALKLKFKKNNEIGSLENKITVNWKGLEREVPVVWIRQFNGAEVTKAVLTMKGSNYGTEGETIGDYWGFLASGDDTQNTYTSDYEGVKLWGVSKTANNGKVRNQGFHFPVMYGSGNDFGSYSYKLTFGKGDNQEKYQDSENVFTVSITPEDWDNTIAVTSTSTEPWEFNISKKENVTEDYTYSTGKLTIKIDFANPSFPDEEFVFDLYHTGFFHKNTTEALACQLDTENKDDKNYYYYEVVPINFGEGTRYMLDRNLSAKSAQNYIRDISLNADGNYTAAGNPDAAGGYYIVAEKNGNYNDPKMIEKIAPPGYRVPQKNAWGAIRSSDNFHTEYNGALFPAYYTTDNPEIGNVYFPKAMFYSGGSFMGESRSGYYWTATAATGTEKDEIGRWLEMLVMTGNTTSYSFGYVKEGINENTTAYGASVRCINDEIDNAKIKRTHFNVAGATHVYLYTGTDETGKTGVATWPGIPVGNYSTVGDGTESDNERNWFGFSYESSQFYPDKLYVIFNYVDKNGRIFTYSQKADGSTQCTTDLTPSECNGWKVEDTFYTNINSGKNMIYPANEILLNPSSTTALGNYWLCKKNDNNNPVVYNYVKGNPYTSVLYLFGDGVAGSGWTNASSIPMYTADGYSYTWTGYLIKLKYFRATKRTTDINLECYQPLTNDYPLPISKEPSQTSMEFTGNDNAHNNWKVQEYGIYSLTFNTSNPLTLTSELLLNNQDIMDKNNTDNPIPAGKRRIYLLNKAAWQSPYIYTWNSSGDCSAPWPGSPMSKVAGTSGYLLYFDVSVKAEKVIFSNKGPSQTADRSISSVSSQLFEN